MDAGERRDDRGGKEAAVARISSLRTLAVREKVVVKGEVNSPFVPKLVYGKGRKEVIWWSGPAYSEDGTTAYESSGRLVQAGYDWEKAPLPPDFRPSSADVDEDGDEHVLWASPDLVDGLVTLHETAVRTRPG